MRRLLAVGCTLALLAALVAPVFAQSVLLGPGGLVNTTTASVAVTNTTTATSIYSYTIPAGLTQGAFAPLHVALVGRLTTNVATGGVGNVNVGCNYGGTTASIALVNAVAFTANLTNMPIKLDLWLSGYSTASTAINGWLQGRLELALVSGTATTAPTIIGAAVDSTTNPGTVNTITCIWQWASAATTNSLVITNGKLVVGD